MPKDDPRGGESTSEWSTEARLLERNRVLLELALHHRRPITEFVPAIQKITEAVGKCFDVERVGLWEFNESRTALRLIDMYTSSTDSHSDGVELLAADYPDYFTALEASRSLAVAHAAEDPRTREFRESYLEPHGIVSLLDSSVWTGDTMRGVLCSETVGQVREWTEADRSFSASAADLIAQTYTAIERRNSQQRVKALSQLYRSIVEDQADCVLRTHPDGSITFINRAGCEQFGCSAEEAMGRPVYDFVPTEDHAIIREHARQLTSSHPVTQYQHRVLLPNGDTTEHEWTLRAFYGENDELLGFQAMGRDVTDRKEREAQLREAQRLQSIALLAGGIAHDFNNLLQPILGYSELALDLVNPGSTEKRYLEHIRVSAFKARELVQQILSFSQDGDGERRPIDLEQVMHETVNFLRASLPATVEFETDIDLGDARVVADSADIYQILSNLLTNAHQAMPAGGTIRLSASVVRTSQDPMVQIVVSDTGSGIDPAIRDRIFEPFFTTRQTSHGTGLGLAVVHGTVTTLGGRISVQSELGQGTSFVIQLPCRVGNGEPETVQPTDVPLGHGERILVIDDEPLVRQTLTDSLKAAGYRVTALGSANEALVVFTAEPDRFDLVLTDLTMPRMSGIELASRLKRLRPRTPILLMTGFVDLVTDDDLRRSQAAALIKKPIPPAALAQTVRAYLAPERTL